ncbi:uncharacterized protein CcaverHIS019_0504070 [Cutaneotrichosporon cavernicola]|uniref:Uncharacterized protein n=1 Tax=Cutaneotrichosporon cavernicola TaxID=279322 RepID=A0AA48L6A3_9TREE|nr:uncharacterized protein CcaverHIS019_0504070 [Cutaneotrichosporon cavernicola]BEI92779.1 hypothetical protein CcaverHIS019_0504070 [Cutaneotrichosporon cavernicola]BEJ00555.1 hypothetical protein CcaverHIS631_0504120 [Cutaneotrichosporon cavernicola]BEJ08323.1 hypothetical protein CcaverHIS641_0504080 [Cutaneotrichosporon cavernicola]
MLRQSKPMQDGRSETARARSLLLSLDYEGIGRYPVPESTVRRDTPLDRGFLLASTRDPIVRPTHKISSSDTVGSASTLSAGSSTSSPTRSPRETTVGAPWDRSPFSMNVVPEAYDGIVTEEQQEILDDAPEQHKAPAETCEHSAGRCPYAVVRDLSRCEEEDHRGSSKVVRRYRSAFKGYRTPLPRSDMISERDPPYNPHISAHWNGIKAVKPLQ